MKLKNIFIALATVAATMGAVSCSDDFDRPPVIVPEATIEANTTILKLKEMYYAQAANMPEIGLTENGEHIIIGGRVVSSDECGNIYQRIIIDDGTAAIPVRVYSSKLYETYHLGQEVRMDVTGLLFGAYSGWYMIGVDYNNGIGGMDADVMSARAQVNGLPDVREIPVYDLTIGELAGIKANETELLTWQSRTVTFKDVTFVGGGQLSYGVAGGTNYTTRTLTDATGAKVDISTSNKCTFAGTTMPTGTGTVTATLSTFGGNWQIVINNPETDVVGFDPLGDPSDPSNPDTPATGAASLTADFETGALPAGWTETVTSGNRNWQVRQFNNNYYAQCSAYQGTAGSDGFRSWLITSAVNFDEMTEKVMSFETEIQYSGDSNLQLYVMTEADPTKAEMVELTFTKPEPNANGSSTGYLFSGEIDLSQFSGVKYVAWLYTASNPAESRTYRVDNVKIGLKADQKPDTPDTPATGTAKFRKVTAITSGKSYVMVIDGQVGTAIAENLTYGRFALANPTSAEGDELTTDAVNAVTFNATEGGYTMVDAYGRYLSMDDSHLTSFQIYTTPQPGSVWAISFNADGTAAIVNGLNSNCNVVRSGTYTNIAPSDIVQYPTFTAPVLYEKAD